MSDAYDYDKEDKAMLEELRAKGFADTEDPVWDGPHANPRKPTEREQSEPRTGETQDPENLPQSLYIHGDYPTPDQSE